MAYGLGLRLRLRVKESTPVCMSREYTVHTHLLVFFSCIHIDVDVADGDYEW